jgi:hypothetical protein
MQRTPRKTAGNKHKEILEALKGDHGPSSNTQTFTFSSPATIPDWPDAVQNNPSLQDPDMYFPLIMDQHLLPEVLCSVPVTRHTKSSVTEQRNTKSEITKLEAQCEQLNLELAKVRLERKQSDLTKALAVEPKEVIQPNPGSGTQLKKAKQITDFLFLTSLDSIEDEGHMVDIGGGSLIQIDRKKTHLSQVTLEQWGFVSLGIFNELIRTGELSPLDIKGYVYYTQSIFRLAANHIWHRVLLYDKEYRDLQAKEGLKLGEPQKDLRDFHLVPKSNSLKMCTVSAMSKAGQYQKVMKNPGLKSTLRRKGPFLPEGREICRKFNSGSCEFQRCRMVHNCAICFSRDHKAFEHNAKNEVKKPQQNSTA